MDEQGGGEATEAANRRHFLKKAAVGAAAVWAAPTVLSQPASAQGSTGTETVSIFILAEPQATPLRCGQAFLGGAWIFPQPIPPDTTAWAATLATLGADPCVPVELVSLSLVGPGTHAITLITPPLPANLPVIVGGSGGANPPVGEPIELLATVRCTCP